MTLLLEVSCVIIITALIQTDMDTFDKHFISTADLESASSPTTPNRARLYYFMPKNSESVPVDFIPKVVVTEKVI